MHFTCGGFAATTEQSMLAFAGTYTIIILFALQDYALLSNSYSEAAPRSECDQLKLAYKLSCTNKRLIGILASKWKPLAFSQKPVLITVHCRPLAIADTRIYLAKNITL